MVEFVGMDIGSKGPGHELLHDGQLYILWYIRYPDSTEILDPDLFAHVTGPVECYRYGHVIAHQEQLYVIEKESMVGDL